MIYCNYDIHLRATVRFIVMYINGNELEKYASMYLYKHKLITEAVVHSSRMTVLHILENSQGSNRGGVLF